MLNQICQLESSEMTLCRRLLKRRCLTCLIVFTSLTLTGYFILVPSSLGVSLNLKEIKIGRFELDGKVEKLHDKGGLSPVGFSLRTQAFLQPKNVIVNSNIVEKSNQRKNSSTVIGDKPAVEKKIESLEERNKQKIDQPAPKKDESKIDDVKKLPVATKDLNSIAQGQKLPQINKIPPQVHKIPPPMPVKIQTGAPKRYLFDSQGYKNYMEYLKKVEPPLPKQNNAVIILTNHRSGSSFFGELFNQHPDAFYIFEPIFPLSNSSECNLNTELKKKILADFAQCTFPDWAKVYSGIPPSKRLKNNSNMKKCILKRVCFRPSTKELCEKEHCPIGNTTKGIKNCVLDCGMVNTNITMNVCRRKRVVVLKVIRLCDILDLKEIMTNNLNDVKVLHLLRDPRGIANSRIPLLRNINVKESLRMTCARQSHNMMKGLLKVPDWLKGRYKAIRYEDAALYPYEIAQSVYDFVGLDFPDLIKDWIFKNTDIEAPGIGTTSGSDLSANSDSTNNNRAKREVDPKLQALLNQKKLKLPLKPQINPYGRKRNSTAVVQKWAAKLPFSKVKDIESVCAKVMKLCGYIPIGSYEQYQVKDGPRYFTDGIRDFNNNLN